MQQEVTVVLQDPRSSPAQVMLNALWDEIQLRYNFTASNDMHTEDFSGPRAGFWVAMAETTPVGSIGLIPLSQEIAELNAMYVAPEFRGVGLAQKLLSALEDYARAQRFSAIRLRAGSGQPEAARFYEKVGFSRIPCFGKYASSDISWCYEKLL